MDLNDSENENGMVSLITSIRSRIIPQLLVIYTRYLIGGAFVFASFIKIKGNRFTSSSGENEPINSLFHFFETMYQSGLFWKFIGLGQLVAGALLMTQRFSFLGAMINLPILSCVFVITISYDFNNTPIITGLMLSANILLLLWDINRLRVFWNKLPLAETVKRMEANMIWQAGGVALLLFTSAYRIYTDNYNALLWLMTCFVIATSILLIAYKKGLLNGK